MATRALKSRAPLARTCILTAGRAARDLARKIFCAKSFRFSICARCTPNIRRGNSALGSGNSGRYFHEGTLHPPPRPPLRSVVDRGAPAWLVEDAPCCALAAEGGRGCGARARRVSTGPRGARAVFGCATGGVVASAVELCRGRIVESAPTKRVGHAQHPGSGPRREGGVCTPGEWAAMSERRSVGLSHHHLSHHSQSAHRERTACATTPSRGRRPRSLT